MKKISAGVKESFEFSELIVQQPSSHNLRVIILYRPPSSDVHRVPINTFFSELADYLESIVLCQEQLLISGDFNIHVDNAEDTDARKLSIYWSHMDFNSMLQVPLINMTTPLT